MEQDEVTFFMEGARDQMRRGGRFVTLGLLVMGTGIALGAILAFTADVGASVSASLASAAVGISVAFFGLNQINRSGRDVEAAILRRQLHTVTLAQVQIVELLQAQLEEQRAGNERLDRLLGG